MLLIALVCFLFRQKTYLFYSLTYIYYLKSKDSEPI